jgi:uncharacterized Tic20 family protein
MKDQSLNDRARYITAICHLIGLMWLPNAIGIFSLLQLVWHVNSGGNLNLFFAALFTVPMIGLLLSAFIAVIFWKINRRSHSFIAESGRNAINFTCTCSLYLAASYFLMIAIWVFSTWLNLEILSSLSAFSLGQYLVLCPVILLSHLCLSIAGAVSTLQGKIYSYFLSRAFFKYNL